MTRVMPIVIPFAVTTLAIILVGCVAIYVAPPPAQFTVIETDVEMTRRAMAEIRTIATAVESYAIDNNQYPASVEPFRPIGEFRFSVVGSLTGLLKPYARFLPKKDPWHRPYLYWSSSQTYAVISTGADGDVTDSLGLVALLQAIATGGDADIPHSSCLEREIVFASGQFYAWPNDPVRRCFGTRR